MPFEGDLDCAGCPCVVNLPYAVEFIGHREIREIGTSTSLSVSPREIGMNIPWIPKDSSVLDRLRVR